jgi:hypothetical protein
MVNLPFQQGPLKSKEKMNKCKILYLDNDNKRRITVLSELNQRFYDKTKIESVYYFIPQKSESCNIENISEIEKNLLEKPKYSSEELLRFIFTTKDLVDSNYELIENAGIDLAIRCFDQGGNGRFHPKTHMIMLNPENHKDIPGDLFHKVIIDNPEGYLEKQSQERMNHEHWQNLDHPWTDIIVSYIMKNRLAK